MQRMDLKRRGLIIYSVGRDYVHMRRHTLRSCRNTFWQDSGPSKSRNSRTFRMQSSQPPCKSNSSAELCRNVIIMTHNPISHSWSEEWVSTRVSAHWSQSDPHEAKDAHCARFCLATTVLNHCGLTTTVQSWLSSIIVYCRCIIL